MPPTCHPVVSQLSYRCGLHLSSNCLSATCLPVLSQLSPRCLPDVVSQVLSPSSPRLLHLLSRCPVVFHLSPRCGLPVVSQMWFPNCLPVVPKCGLQIVSRNRFPHPRIGLPVVCKCLPLVTQLSFRWCLYNFRVLIFHLPSAPRASALTLKPPLLLGCKAGGQYTPHLLAASGWH